MIITITLNPALDKTAQIESLKIGALNRLDNVINDPGGKGVNVSKMIKALGGKSLATGFAGAKSGEEIIEKLNDLGIDNDFVKTHLPTRTNLKIIDANGALTEINEPGAFIDENEISALTDKVIALAKPDNIFVFSGSIPKGVPTDIYAKLINAARKKGAISFLDADGEAFRAALKEKPDFIKPNLYELKQFFGVDKDLTLKETAALCQEIIKTGVKAMALTMGADGALFLCESEVLFARGLKVQVRSTVGAGDSFVGAYAYAFGQKTSWKKAVSLAMAASAAAAATQGVRAPDKGLVLELLEQVELKKIETED